MKFIFSAFGMLLVLIVLCCHASMIVHGLCSHNGEQQISASVPQFNAQYGYNVAIGEVSIVVGAYRGGGLHGRAYVYQTNNSVNAFDFVERAILSASDGSYSDFFGTSVGVNGLYVVVGSLNDDEDSASIYADTGSVYIYMESSLGQGDFLEVNKLTVADDSGDIFFGTSLAIDSTSIVIGAFTDRSMYYNSGAIFVFQESLLHANDFAQISRISASDASAGDNFGTAIDVSGISIVVGAYADDDAGEYSGSAYVFQTTVSTNDFVEIVKLTPNDMAGQDRFGCAVAIEEETIVVGSKWDDVNYHYNSGSAYVFRESVIGAGDFVQVAKLIASTTSGDESYGTSVDISGDKIVMGGWFSHTAGGSAVVFGESPDEAGVFEELMILQANNSIYWDNFGWSLSIYQDTVVIGAYGHPIDGVSASGAAYVYNISTEETEDCTNECSSNPCLNGAVCVDEGWTYSCSCSPITAGDICETCLCNNGICDHMNEVCNCTSMGATGSLCESDIDDCASMPCLNEGVCVDDGARPHQFNCSCPALTTGPLCEECICLNNGTCVSSSHDDHLLVCNCTDMFHGELCELEYNACTSSPCRRGGLCTVSLSTYSCNCTGTGGTGSDCSEDIVVAPTSSVLSNYSNGTIISFVIYVPGFLAGTTIEDYTDSLPNMLATAVGGSPYEYDISVSENIDGSYNIFVVYTTTKDISISEVIERTQDPDSELHADIDGTIIVDKNVPVIAVAPESSQEAMSCKLYPSLMVTILLQYLITCLTM